MIVKLWMLFLIGDYKDTFGIICPQVIFVPVYVAAVVMHIFAPKYRMQGNPIGVFLFIVFHQVFRYILCFFNVYEYVAVENKIAVMVEKTCVADHKAGRPRLLLVMLFEQLVYFIK